MESEIESDEDWVAMAPTQNEGEDYVDDETSNLSTQNKVDEVSKVDEMNNVDSRNEANESNRRAEEKDDNAGNSEARADAVKRHRPEDDNNTNESSIKRQRAAKTKGIKQTAMIVEQEQQPLTEWWDHSENGRSKGTASVRSGALADEIAERNSAPSVSAGAQAREDLSRHCQGAAEDGDADRDVDEEDEDDIDSAESDDEDRDFGTSETRKASTAETKDYALDRDKFLFEFACAIKGKVLAEISSARFELSPPEKGGGGQSLYRASGNKKESIVLRQNSRKISNQKFRDYIDDAESQGENFVELWNNALANKGSRLQIKGFETRMEERGKKKKITKVTYFVVRVIDTTTPPSNRVSLMSYASEPQCHPCAPIKLPVSRQILMGSKSQDSSAANTSLGTPAEFEAGATSSSTSSSSRSAHDRRTEESHPSFSNCSAAQQIRLLQEHLEEEKKKREDAETEAEQVRESRAETEKQWEAAKKERDIAHKKKRHYQEKYEQEKKKRENLQQEVEGMLVAIHALHRAVERFKQKLS